MNEIFLTREEIEHPYANLTTMLENKRKKIEIIKNTRFEQITRSPEILVNKLIYSIPVSYYNPIEDKSKGKGIILKEEWKSTLTNKTYNSKSEAFDDTLKKLKEKC